MQQKRSENPDLQQAARALAYAELYDDRAATTACGCDRASLTRWRAKYQLEQAGGPEFSEAFYHWQQQFSSPGETVKRATIATNKLLDTISAFADRVQSDPESVPADMMIACGRTLDYVRATERQASQTAALEPLRRKVITKQLELELTISGDP